MPDLEDDKFSPRHEFARAVQGVGGGSLDHLFSIRDYSKNIAKHWRMFIVAVLIGTVWAVYYEMTAPKMYSVIVYVGPVGDAPAQSSGVGGLVSMFISGGSMSVGPPEWSRYVFALSSVELAEKLDREHHMLMKVFGGRWDPKTKRWKEIPGFDASVSRFFAHLFGLPSDVPPDIKALQGYISASVILSTDKTTGVSTLTSTSPDPKKALAFLLLVHNTAIDLVREEIATRNDAKMDYLTRMLSKTSNADQRSVLIGMLAATEQTQMLLNNHLPFAAQIIDTPVVPTMPSSPRTFDVALTYRIGVLIFLILAMLALDQIAGTNFVEFTDTKIRRFPHSVMVRISRYREYGWQGIFSRS